MSRAIVVFLFVVALWSAARPASAQTCTVSLSPIVFGTVSPIRNTAVNTTATLNISCEWTLISLGPSAVVCVNLGLGNTSTSQNPRTMGNGTRRLQYRVADNPAFSPLWGSTATGTTPISVVLTKPLLGTSASTSRTINAQVLPGQGTVPTVNNETTVYTETFSATAATVNYAYYLLGQPACSSIGVRASFSPQVTANVVNDCIFSAMPMDFGTRGVLAAAVTATATLNVRCTNGDAWRIALNGGLNGTVAARRMRRVDGTQTVAYQLYTDAGRSVPWGDGTAGTSMVQNVGTGTQQTVTVYGRVDAQTTPMPGTYSDTVTATIYF